MAQALPSPGGLLCALPSFLLACGAKHALKYFLYDHSKEFEEDKVAGETSALDRADDGTFH